MKAIWACLLGMMIGSIALLWAAAFKPHSLDSFQAASVENFLCKK